MVLRDGVDPFFSVPFLGRLTHARRVFRDRSETVGNGALPLVDKYGCFNLIGPEK